MEHRIGNSVQDCVTIGGCVLTGLSLECGRCRKTCIVEFPRAQFTSDKDVPEKLFCPYCGAAGVPKMGSRITDTRPFGSD